MTKKINRRNNHIVPELYTFYLHLKKTLGAQIVHRRRRAINHFTVLQQPEPVRISVEYTPPN